MILNEITGKGTRAIGSQTPMLTYFIFDLIRLREEKERKRKERSLKNLLLKAKAYCLKSFKQKKVTPKSKVDKKPKLVSHGKSYEKSKVKSQCCG